MSKPANLQDTFLDKLQQEKRAVIIITTNGFQMRGRIAGHDQYILLLDVDGQQQLVFKSAISTIKEG